MQCISKDCWFIGCIRCGCERVCCNCGFCKIVCICICIIGICCICCGGGCWVIVIVGFLPPINLSWLRAFSIRFPCRIPMASSNDASVRERAKLTCFVLFMREWKMKVKLAGDFYVRMRRKYKFAMQSVIFGGKVSWEVITWGCGFRAFRCNFSYLKYTLL